MVTSNTYNFQNSFTVDIIIKEAFERCGLLSDITTANQLQSAQRSLNIMFTNWLNRGLNLWAVDQQMIQLVPNQATYMLPPGTVDILSNECKIAKITRQLNGSAYSSAGGVAANAFDGDSSTACTQTAPNGYISYDFGAGLGWAINYIGIQANATITYTLAFEYSFDNVNWYNAYNGVISTAINNNQPQPYNFIPGQIAWFVPTVPVWAEFWRVRETGGNTLDIQEIYFNTPNSAKNITRLSRGDYESITNYNQISDVSSFVVNRLVNPNVEFWPTPSPQSSYTTCIFNRKRMIQDVSDFISTVDNPQRFFEALCAGLAALIAQKFAYDKYDALRQVAEDAFVKAASSDTEDVSLYLQPNMSNYY